MHNVMHLKLSELLVRLQAKPCYLSHLSKENWSCQKYRIFSANGRRQTLPPFSPPRNPAKKDPLHEIRSYQLLSITVDITVQIINETQHQT
jgi:hypothetical protein